MQFHQTFCRQTFYRQSFLPYSNNALPSTLAILSKSVFVHDAVYSYIFYLTHHHVIITVGDQTVQN